MFFDKQDVRKHLCLYNLTFMFIHANNLGVKPRAFTTNSDTFKIPVKNIS